MLCLLPSPLIQPVASLASQSLLSIPSTMVWALAMSGLYYCKRSNSPPVSTLTFKISLPQMPGCTLTSFLSQLYRELPTISGLSVSLLKCSNPTHLPHPSHLTLNTLFLRSSVTQLSPPQESVLLGSPLMPHCQVPGMFSKPYSYSHIASIPDKNWIKLK